MSRRTCILTSHICALHGLIWNYIMLVIILIPYFPYFTQVRYLIPRLNRFASKSENTELGTPNFYSLFHLIYIRLKKDMRDCKIREICL